MPKPYQLALHIFRRDLRLQDNSALIEALASSERVIPCFIFDKRQIEANAYKSKHCIAFMATSLIDLEEQLERQQGKLYYFYGIAEEVVAQLLSKLPIDAVFLNRDYTPFSLTRDRQIAVACEQHKVAFHSYADALLHEPEQVHKADGLPYTIYTPFFKRASQLPVSPPRKTTANNFYQQAIPLADNTMVQRLAQHSHPNLAVKGGRQEAIALLKKMQHLTNYPHDRDYPALNATSHLSAHNKFGTVSIREVHKIITRAFGSKHTLLNEIYWRDFFTHIAWHFPNVFGEAFQPKYVDIPWQQNDAYFKRWCEGRTGFPIVDAGMRELNTTGYMHNRVRMIVASFLCKDLLIDWRLGEKYFAQQLVDYDPCVNNGNWQWAASTGCDAQPYFRIFNPWLQQQKFDADCLYIKRFIPELNALSPREIHQWYQHMPLMKTNYPQPIVDHGTQSSLAKALFKAK